MRAIGYPEPAALRLATAEATPVSVHVATGFWDRFMGLMGQASMRPLTCVAFPRCASIHMFWMRFPIDVAWLGRPGEDGTCPVLGVELSLAPWRVAFGPRGTWGAAELPAGTISTAGQAVALECPALVGGK